MVTFLYRCPTTGCALEGRRAEPAPSAASPLVTYVAEHCPACRGLHIVNPATGRLMGEEIAMVVPAERKGFMNRLLGRRAA